MTENEKIEKIKLDSSDKSFHCFGYDYIFQKRIKWYLLQDVYGNSYEDGSDNSYDNGSDSQDSSWYNCYDYSYGDGVMACMEDVYSNHGFLSLWVTVQSAFIPQTALAFAIACAIDAYPSDGECYESFN